MMMTYHFNNKKHYQLMKEVITTLKQNLNKFSMRGFLFRRTPLSKLLYILDLTLMVVTMIIFCLVLTSVISGVFLTVYFSILSYV